MADFFVAESDEGIRETILRGLAAWGKRPESCGSEVFPALLVVSPGAVRQKRRFPERCRILLAPGDAGRAIRDIHAASAVSYGGAGRDSLTVSSREKDRIMAALQRELVTLDGRVVERQEFALEPDPGRGEQALLAAAGALLLLGVTPEDVPRVLAARPEV